MEDLRGFFVLVIFLLGVSVEAKFFKFEDCTGKTRIAKANKFEIAPDPVNMRKNMTVTMDLDILQNVPEKAMLRTRYYKLKSVFGINIDVPIPCLLGKFGSCTNSLCKYLNMFEEQAKPLFPPDLSYGCPIQAGHYRVENIKIPIPNMGSIARLIVSGKYRTELELVVDQIVVACYKIWSEMR